MLSLTGGGPGISQCFDCNPGWNLQGKLQADVVLANARHATHILFVTSPDSPSTTACLQGVEAIAKQYGGGTTVSTVSASLSAPSSTNDQTVITALLADSSIRYLIVPADTTVEGLIQQMKSVGLLSRVKVVEGHTVAPLQLQELRDGELLASVGRSAYVPHWEAANAAAEISVGDLSPTARNYPVGWYRIFTAQNVNTANGGLPPGFEKTYERAWGVR